MNSKMLKTSLDISVTPLTILYKSVNEVHWLDTETISKITKLYKKGNMDNPGDFKTIAIIPVLGKGLEHTMKLALISNFEKNSLQSIKNLKLVNCK